ncbi:MAG: hypothetical protein RMI79_07345 [Nitrososphaerota archaeon]|nr:hypothetical protein [Nitrososphaerota archaeon]
MLSKVVTLIIVLVLFSVFYVYYYYNIDESVLRSKRTSFLIKYAGATESEAISFDREYSHLAQGTEYNQTILEFFYYWRMNSSLASACLRILKDVGRANSYLSRVKNTAVNFLSINNLTLVLSVHMDKEEYVINENKKLNLTIAIVSDRDLGEIGVEIFGFKSPYRGYVVKNKWINGTDALKIAVQKGLNLKTFSDIDIPCSPCYGIKSGLNNITCVIKFNNLSLSVTKTFLLKSGS